MDDVFADLGLNLDANAPSDTVDAPTAEDGEKKVRVPRTEVKLAEVKVESGFALAPIVRGAGFGGGRESKYKFAELVAPKRKADGSLEDAPYDTFSVIGEDGEDEKKVASSVRAAAAAQNKKHKEDGSITKFATRVEKKGIRVYRVDDTLSDEDAAG